MHVDRGWLRHGFLTKTDLAKGSNVLVHHIAMEFGPPRARQFLDDCGSLCELFHHLAGWCLSPDERWMPMSFQRQVQEIVHGCRLRERQQIAAAHDAQDEATLRFFAMTTPTASAVGDMAEESYGKWLVATHERHQTTLFQSMCDLLVELAQARSEALASFVSKYIKSTFPQLPLQRNRIVLVLSSRVPADQVTRLARLTAVHQKELDQLLAEKSLPHHPNPIHWRVEVDREEDLVEARVRAEWVLDFARKQYDALSTHNKAVQVWSSLFEGSGFLSVFFAGSKGKSSDMVDQVAGLDFQTVNGEPMALTSDGRVTSYNAHGDGVDARGAATNDCYTKGFRLRSKIKCDICGGYKLICSQGLVFRMGTWYRNMGNTTQNHVVHHDQTVRDSNGDIISLCAGQTNSSGGVYEVLLPLAEFVRFTRDGLAIALVQDQDRERTVTSAARAQRPWEVRPHVIQQAATSWCLSRCFVPVLETDRALAAAAPPLSMVALPFLEPPVPSSNAPAPTPQEHHSRKRKREESLEETRQCGAEAGVEGTKRCSRAATEETKRDIAEETKRGDPVVEARVEETTTVKQWANLQLDAARARKTLFLPHEPMPIPYLFSSCQDSSDLQTPSPPPPPLAGSVSHDVQQWPHLLWILFRTLVGLAEVLTLRRGLELTRTRAKVDLSSFLPHFHPSYDDPQEESACFATFRQTFESMDVLQIGPALNMTWTHKATLRRTRVVWVLEKKVDIPAVTKLVQRVRTQTSRLDRILFLVQSVSPELETFRRTHNRRVLRERARERAARPEHTIRMGRMKKTVMGTAVAVKRRRAPTKKTPGNVRKRKASTAAEEPSSRKQKVAAEPKPRKRKQSAKRKTSKKGGATESAEALAVMKLVRTHPALEGKDLPLLEFSALTTYSFSCLMHRNRAFPQIQAASSAQMVADLGNVLQDIQQLPKIYESDPSMVLQGAMEGDVYLSSDVIPDRGHRVWEPRIVLRDSARLYHQRSLKTDWN